MLNRFLNGFPASLTLCRIIIRETQAKIPEISADQNVQNKLASGLFPMAHLRTQLPMVGTTLRAYIPVMVTVEHLKPKGLVPRGQRAEDRGATKQSKVSATTIAM